MNDVDVPHTAPVPDSALLRLRDVSRTYLMGEVEVRVLRHLDLDVHRGEILAIVGPSGSGKSTILNLVGGLDSPTAGEIWYGERDLTAARPPELTRYRRDEVGFIFQFFNLVPTLTARENIQVVTEIAREPREVDEVLELVGLEDRADHFPSQLSGGEQQRVAIARAVVKNPQLLLCDEPTGSLDYATGIKVLRLLVDLNDRLRTTVVLITHNGAIARVAHRIIHLRSGEISETEENRSPSAPEEVAW